MESSFQGFTMLQADKDDAEALGLVKLDVLGVRMLSSIAHACGEIARVRSEHHGGVDVNSIPRDDAATFELIRSSRTLGCFQIESPGQRELLARFQPNRFEDLVIDISLFRPGPVKSDMVSPFLERRHGFEPVRYPHPSLAAILEETHGVVVYHEQVIRVIAAVTGCSLDDADYVRRHLGDADADDVAQDAFLRAFNRLSSFRGESPFRAWLLRITHNAALNALARRPRLQPVDSVDELIESSDAGAPPVRSPVEQLEVSERRDRLMLKISLLSPQHRAVLALRDLEGLSYDEIAQVTETPLGSVKGRLHRARGELIELLRSNSYDWDLPR